MGGSERKHSAFKAMSYSIKFTKPALEDIRSGFLWYETLRSGLGDGFLNAVEKQIEKIQERPESFVIFVDDYRKGNTKKFPFKIIFSIKEKEITIWAVYHHRRSISKWKR